MAKAIFLDSGYSDHDTDWATSAKGNEWRRIDGKLLVVGYRHATGKFWAMSDGVFAKGAFDTMKEAMDAAERLFKTKAGGREGWL